MPDQSNADPIIDRKLLKRNRKRALDSPRGLEDFLYRWAADDIVERLGAVMRDFKTVVDLGGLCDGVVSRLANSSSDIAIRMDSLSSNGGHVVFDDEAIPLRDQSVDLISSILQLQWVNDLPGALIQIRRALKPDGLFLASIIGAGSLYELRESLLHGETEAIGGAHPRVMPLISVQEAGSLLQRAGFALPVVDQQTLTVRYDNPIALMHDLRAMGASNSLGSRSRLPLPRKMLEAACHYYHAHFSDEDGRIRATYNIVSVSGWAPHESQQKPLSPGSAKMRLADALGTIEYSHRDMPDE